MPKSEFEQTMERIRASIARTQIILEDILEKRGVPRERPQRPPLTLVPNDDEEGDDA